MGVGEIGSYRTCEGDLEPYGDHVVLSVNFTTLPSTLRFGFCLPKECKQSEFTAISDAVTNMLNNAYTTFYNMTATNTPLTNGNTRFTIKLTKTTETHE
jgi:hypothetical protein